METQLISQQGIDYRLSHALYLFGHLKEVDHIGEKSHYGIERALYTIGYLKNTLSVFPEDENIETRDKIAQAITKISNTEEVRDGITGYRKNGTDSNGKGKEKFSLTSDELDFLEKLSVNCMGNVDKNFNYWPKETIAKGKEVRSLYKEFTGATERKVGETKIVGEKAETTVPLVQRDFIYWENLATTPGSYMESDIPELLKMYIGLQKAKKDHSKN